MTTEGTNLDRLRKVLHDSAPAAIAVSGGVDSMTLAFVAQRTLGDAVTMFHAVSPAVPPNATARIRAYAAAETWTLRILDAGEFADARYLRNPANRCFFCKSNLYAGIAGETTQQLLSGTNLDDLDDWRPGLEAAANAGVRHPFVEAGIDKAAVRAIARSFDLADVAELPAAPCLSSRVETGIPIAAPGLRFVDAAEQHVRGAVNAETVRCRIRRSGIVIELDPAAFEAIDAARRSALTGELDVLARASGMTGRVTFARYERGSAFLREPA